MSRSITIEGVAVEVKSHAKLSPSSAKRWMNCPGSIRLIEELGIKDKTSKFAAEGTVAHEVGELCLLNDKSPSEYLGKEIEADGFTFKVSQNMVDAVDEYVDYIWNQIGDAKVGSDLYVELQVEVKCSLKVLGIEGLDGGTSDTLLICREHQWVEVIDYKHGQGVPVEVKGNPQLMSYGLGALHELGIDDLDDWDVKLTIVQPRAHHPDGRIRSTHMNSSDLFHWQDTKLVPAAILTSDHDAPFKATDEGCRFCKAAGQCRTLNDMSQRTAIQDFQHDTYPHPNVMSIEQKVIVMEHREMLRSFIVAVENQVKLEVDTGSKDYEDKFKLVKGRSHRKFVNDYDDNLSPLADHLLRSELYTEKALPIGEVEALLKSKLGSTPDSKKQVIEIMKAVTIKPEGKLVIAPITDSREAVLPAISSDFIDLVD